MFCIGVATCIQSSAAVVSHAKGNKVIITLQNEKVQVGDLLNLTDDQGFYIDTVRVEKILGRRILVETSNNNLKIGQRIKLTDSLELNPADDTGFAPVAKNTRKYFLEFIGTIGYGRTKIARQGIHANIDISSNHYSLSGFIEGGWVIANAFDIGLSAGAGYHNFTVANDSSGVMMTAGPMARYWIANQWGVGARVFPYSVLAGDGLSLSGMSYALGIRYSRERKSSLGFDYFVATQKKETLKYDMSSLLLSFSIPF